MRFIKLIVLTAVAAVLMMAAYGAASASATGLCKVSETPCKAANAYASGQSYTATSKSSVFENNVENVTCTESSTTLKQTSANTAAGVALPGQVTALSFNKCTSANGFGCEVKTRNLPYGASLQLSTAPNGKLSIFKVSGNASVSVSCFGGFLKCIFGIEGTFEVKGGNPASVVVAKLKLSLIKEEGFIECPKEASWTATFNATSPTNWFVSAS